jgi:hypothetical protein
MIMRFQIKHLFLAMTAAAVLLMAVEHRRFGENRCWNDNPSIKGSGVGFVSPAPSWRAYTMSATSVSDNLAGLIRPGERVDILFVRSTTNNGEGRETVVTLIRSVEILAVDHFLDPKTNAKQVDQVRSVTLRVDPDMAAKLHLAKTKGKLKLALPGWNFV